ncbi:MAG: peptide chain release factor 1 [Pseudomonadota bacterium]
MRMNMKQYDDIVIKYESLEKELNLLIANDPGNYNKINSLTKNVANLKDIYEKIQEYKNCVNEKNDINILLKQEDATDMQNEAKQMLIDIDKKMNSLVKEIDVLLVANDANLNKNVYIEIRAGVGGSEASLFVNDIFNMYVRYIESMGWKYEISSISHKQGGGVKEIVMFVKGGNVYSCLQYESGGHRVQRIPATESSGRVHTSMITVAVLPEVDEIEVELDTKDLRITTCKSSGAGGQHVNTTDSAVSILHIPTGITVEQSSERSQHQNKAKALKLLRAKLYDKYLHEQQSEVAASRKEQVGSGDRSDKIRTYNIPQSRVTDHRIGLTVYKLNAVLKEGKIHDFILELRKFFNSKRRV